jgi:hypothetical protein
MPRLHSACVRACVHTSCVGLARTRYYVSAPPRMCHGPRVSVPATLIPDRYHVVERRREAPDADDGEPWTRLDETGQWVRKVFPTFHPTGRQQAMVRGAHSVNFLTFCRQYPDAPTHAHAFSLTRTHTRLLTHAHRCTHTHTLMHIPPSCTLSLSRQVAPPLTGCFWGVQR